MSLQYSMRFERFKYILEHLCYVILNKIKDNTYKVMHEGTRNLCTNVYRRISTATYSLSVKVYLLVRFSWYLDGLLTRSQYLYF